MVSLSISTLVSSRCTPLLCTFHFSVGELSCLVEIDDAGKFVIQLADLLILSKVSPVSTMLESDSHLLTKSSMSMIHSNLEKGE